MTSSASPIGHDVIFGMTKQKQPQNAFTVDLEAWFHAHNLNIPRPQWDHLPLRLDEPIRQLLSLLKKHRTRATFFVLGYVAKRQPALVTAIHQAGHEIASHGMNHERIDQLSQSQFRDDVAQSKTTLESLISQPVIGYRAPAYSINSQTHWALNALHELGIRYDSSIYPVRSPHGRYGVRGASLSPTLLDSGLYEFPLPTWKIGHRRLPAATGGYLRLWPMLITRQTFLQYEKENRPVVINVHPWELDPNQPRQKVPFVRRLSHYTNLSKTLPRLDQLLSKHKFSPLRDMYQTKLNRNEPISANLSRIRNIIPTGREATRSYKHTAHL